MRCFWYMKRWWHWGSSPSGNCAWNRPGGCGENEKDERINGKDVNGKQKHEDKKKIRKKPFAKEQKKKKPEKGKDPIVGTGLWTVQQWLKHG